MFVSLSPTQYASLAHQLERDGAVAVPALTPEYLREVRQDWKDVLRTFPEYRRDAGNPGYSPSVVNALGKVLPRTPVVYVKGGFGALGNPASIHNPVVRRLRWDLHEHVMPLLARLNHSGRMRVHTIVDRMRIRRADAAVGEETWHRDTTPAKFVDAGDQIFGGWINLDRSRDQYLSCVLGSHQRNAAAPNAREGFSKLSDAEQKALGAEAHDRVVVPPGYVLLFVQDLIHEVVAVRKLDDTRVDNADEVDEMDAEAIDEQEATDTRVRPEYRLFTSWRLTEGNRALAPTLPPDFFSAMAVPHLKSGQEMVMFPRTGNTFGSLKAAITFSNWCMQTFPDVLLKTWERKDKKTGQVDYLRILEEQTLPSLEALCTTLGVHNPYPAYSREEMAIYVPHVECVARGGERIRFQAAAAAPRHVIEISSGSDSDSDDAMSVDVW